MTVRSAITSPACATFQSMRSSTARISLRDCVIGLPTSLVVMRAHSSASAASRSRNAAENRRALVVGTRRPGGLRGAGAGDLLGDLPGLGDRHRAQHRRRSRGRGSRANAVGQAAGSRLAVEPRSARLGRRPAPARRRAGARHGRRRARGAASTGLPSGPAAARAAARIRCPARRPSASSTSSSERNECQRSAALLQLTGRLRAAQQQHAEQRRLGPVETERLLGDVAMLDDALAGRLHSPRQLLLAQPVERALDRRLAVVRRSGRGWSSGCTRSRPRSPTAGSCRAS